MEEAKEHPKLEDQDPILDLAIQYAVHGTYPEDLSKGKKRSVRKRAQTLKIENGDVFVERKNKKMRVVTSKTDQIVIMNSCHSDPTSGLTKTWKRVAERFYWKGMVADIQEVVSSYLIECI